MQEAKQREVASQQLRHINAAHRLELRHSRTQLRVRKEAMLDANRSLRALLLPEAGAAPCEPSPLHTRMAQWGERKNQPSLHVGQWKRAFKVRGRRSSWLRAHGLERWAGACANQPS
jgi:hypothetical protein